jgi:superfamily I DNA and/or RNA helicase
METDGNESAVKKLSEVTPDISIKVAELSPAEEAFQLIDEELREHEDNELEVVERMKAVNDNIFNETGTNMVDDEFDDTDESLLHSVKNFPRAAVDSNKM